LVFNFSIFYFQILDLPDLALYLATVAVNNTEHDLSESSKESSKVIKQLCKFLTICTLYTSKAYKEPEEEEEPEEEADVLSTLVEKLRLD
jgi:hypothetical protein